MNEKDKTRKGDDNTSFQWGEREENGLRAILVERLKKVDRYSELT